MAGRSLSMTTANEAAGRIAVLAPTGALNIQPAIINAIRCFTAAGYAVDVFSIRNHRYTAPDLGAGAKVRYLPITFNSLREPRILATLAFTAWLPWAMRGRYDAVFAGGVRALIAVWLTSWVRSRKVINLQLELYVGQKLKSRLAGVFKWIERRAIRSCWLTLIQDESRANMLRADVGIPAEKMVLVPNSPLGPGRIRTSRFLHDRLGLNKETNIVLAPGSIGPLFCSEETVVAAQALPEQWQCVIHSAQPVPDGDPYIARINTRNVRNRVAFSLSPLPYELVDQLLSSARIGLALYGAIGGPNTTEVGLASGKLCQFLKVGVPVIVSDFPVLRDFVLTHKVGLPMAAIEDLPRLVADIEKDYAGYRQRAVQAFDQALSFDRHFKQVIDRLPRFPASTRT
jgi:glycosyltransferase involved in cell wall biosynthesis